MPKKKFSPLPSAAFQILVAVAGEELHGYAIMRQIEEQTGGRTRLGPGTLYSSIQALVDAGLMEETEPGGSTGSGRRRYYRLTSAGRKAARSEAERLAALVRAARAKNLVGGEHA